MPVVNLVAVPGGLLPDAWIKNKIHEFIFSFIEKEKWHENPHYNKIICKLELINWTLKQQVQVV